MMQKPLIVSLGYTASCLPSIKTIVSQRKASVTLDVIHRSAPFCFVEQIFIVLCGYTIMKSAFPSFQSSLYLPVPRKAPSVFNVK